MLYVFSIAYHSYSRMSWYKRTRVLSAALHDYLTTRTALQY